ncbi:MAG: CidA/LrgA family protein [Tumebacillaceae bacterium]
MLTIIWQILLLCGLTAVGKGLTAWMGVPIPGSIIGFLLLFLLLQTKIVKLEWVEKGATFLLGRLLLFFVPPAVGIIEYQNVISTAGWRLIAVIVVGTLLVMSCTGLVAEFVHRLRKEGTRDVVRHQ